MDGPDPAHELDEDQALIESLPKEVGVMLVIAGFGGILLPGPVGAPLLVLGGAVLFPGVFKKVDRAFQRRFPAAHDQGMKQVRRFAVDLEHRYPKPDLSSIHDPRANSGVIG